MCHRKRAPTLGGGCAVDAGCAQGARAAEGGPEGGESGPAAQAMVWLLAGRRQEARDGLSVPPALPRPFCSELAPRCAKGHRFYECPTIAARGEDGGEVIELISELSAKVRQRLKERVSIGVADEDYDRFDLITAMPMVPYLSPLRT